MTVQGHETHTGLEGFGVITSKLDCGWGRRGGAEERAGPPRGGSGPPKRQRGVPVERERQQWRGLGLGRGDCGGLAWWLVGGLCGGLGRGPCHAGRWQGVGRA